MGIGVVRQNSTGTSSGTPNNGASRRTLRDFTYEQLGVFVILNDQNDDPSRRFILKVREVSRDATIIVLVLWFPTLLVSRPDTEMRPMVQLPISVLAVGISIPWGLMLSLRVRPLRATLRCALLSLLPGAVLAFLMFLIFVVVGARLADR